MTIYIVVEYWDETNGVSIEGVFTDIKLAQECENKDRERRWIRVWKIKHGMGVECD